MPLRPPSNHAIPIPMSPPERDFLADQFRALKDASDRLYIQIARRDRVLLVDGRMQAACLRSVIEASPGTEQPALQRRIRTLVPGV
jgi:hypothetical protein